MSTANLAGVWSFFFVEILDGPMPLPFDQGQMSGTGRFREANSSTPNTIRFVLADLLLEDRHVTDGSH